MTGRSLQVTDRNGRASAAHWHLSRVTGESSAKSMSAPDGLLFRRLWVHRPRRRYQNHKLRRRVP